MQSRTGQYGSILRRMRIACCIPKATNTHSEGAIFILFLLQQWLYIGVSTLRYTYIACLVITLHKTMSTPLLVVVTSCLSESCHSVHFSHPTTWSNRYSVHWYLSYRKPCAQCGCLPLSYVIQ